MALIVTNARLITVPAGADDPGYIERGWLLAGDDGRIAGIGSGDAPETDGEVLDVGGAFVAPGFVSSHSHLFTSGTRGLGVGETLYGWCDAMFSVLRHADPEDMYWATLHGSLDFLSNGVTTAYDFTDPRIPWEPMVGGRREGAGALRPLAHQTRQIDAKADAGIRFVNSIPLDDVIGDPEEVLARFGEAAAHLAALDPDLALAAAVTGAVQWSPREDAAEIEVAAMRRFGVVNQAHFLETREAVDLQRTKFARYRDAGALGPDMLFGHFIQTTPEIIREAASAGAGMSWQPASNGRLASGVAQVPEMLALGMRVGVGLDDQACTDVSDPWQNMRIGIYQQRARTGDPSSMSPETMLRLHTLGGAELLGVADRVGSLEVGKFADFVVVDPRRPDIGPLWHPVRSYVLACSLRNLKAVYVGGALVADADGATSPLAARAADEVHERLPRIAAANGVEPV